MGQSHGRLVGEDVRCVPETLRLQRERFNKVRMAVAQGIDCDATGEVDVLSAILVPNACTTPVDGNDGHGGVVGDHDMFVKVSRYGCIHCCTPSPKMLSSVERSREFSDSRPTEMRR